MTSNSPEKLPREFLGKFFGGYPPEYVANHILADEKSHGRYLEAARKTYEDVLRRKALWKSGRFDEAVDGLNNVYHVNQFVEYGAFPIDAIYHFVGSEYHRSAWETLEAYKEWQNLRTTNAPKKDVAAARAMYKALREREIDAWKKLPKGERRGFSASPEMALHLKATKIKHGVGLSGRLAAFRARRSIRQEIKGTHK